MNENETPLTFTLPTLQDQWHQGRNTPKIAFLVQSGFAIYLGFVALIFASMSYYAMNPLDLIFKYLHPALLFLNLLPPFCIFWMVNFLSRKPCVAYGITATLTAIVGLVNYYKIAIRGAPFLLSDLGLIWEATVIVGEYTLDKSVAVLLLWTFLLLGFGLIYYLMPYSYVIPLDRKRSFQYCGVTVAVFIFFWFTCFTSSWVYNQTESYNNINRLSYSEVYLSRGLWYPFLNSSSTRISVEDVDTEELMEMFESETSFPIGDITVVSIMLEGFCDLTDFPAMANEQKVWDVYAPWHILEETGVGGEIINTVFAGGTAYTERSFLTGLPAAYDDFTQPTPSYVWEFKEAGYPTFGAHLGYQDFYSRVDVNPNLGFEEYYFYEDIYSDLVLPSSMYFDSDWAFFDSVIDLLEEKKNRPSFSFFVSIQNHGPYSVAEDMSNPYISTSAGLSEESRGILQTYLQGVENTLYHLQRLEAYLWERQDPVVLVIFGDHMPWMGNANEVLIEVGGSLDISTTQGMLDYFGTPYLIWANQAARNIITGDYPAQGETISNHFLMNLVFETIGWDQSPAMAFSTFIMEELPVVFHSWEYAYWVDDEVVVDIPQDYADWIGKYHGFIALRRTEYYTPK